MDTNESSSLFDVQADYVMQNKITTISKWTRFISITGIVIVTLFIVAFATLGQRIYQRMADMLNLDSASFGVMAFFLVLIMAVIIVWFVFLLRASSQLKQGVQTGNSEVLAEGFKSLRIYFVISAIITILSILSTFSTLIKFK